MNKNLAREEIGQMIRDQQISVDEHMEFVRLHARAMANGEGGDLNSLARHAVGAKSRLESILELIEEIQ